MKYYMKMQIINLWSAYTGYSQANFTGNQRLVNRNKKGPERFRSWTAFGKNGEYPRRMSCWTKPWTYLSRWASCGFFRLFRASGTCSPKPV